MKCVICKLLCLLHPEKTLMNLVRDSWKHQFGLQCRLSGSSAQPGMIYNQRKVSHEIFCIVDHWNDSNYVDVFDECAGPKNTDNTVSLVSNYLFHSGLVPQGVKCVCLFLDNATLMNKNWYSLGGLGAGSAQTFGSLVTTFYDCRTHTVCF